MKVKVIEDACIGCGACVSICPEVFQFNYQGLAHVINDNIDESLKERVMDALESCPTNAIVEE